MSKGMSRSKKAMLNSAMAIIQIFLMHIKMFWERDIQYSKEIMIVIILI